MLRTLVVVLALATPSLAMAQQSTEQFPQSAVGIDVVGDDGAVIGRVDAVERDADGRVVSAELSNLEPGSAPYASSDLVAERNDLYVPVRDQRNLERSAGGNQRRTR